MVCRRNDFMEQQFIKNQIANTEEIAFDAIYERYGQTVFLLNETEYEKAGLNMTWVNNVLLAGIALDLFDQIEE